MRVEIMLTLVEVSSILYTQTASSQTTLNCDLPERGYSAGLVNKGASCSTTLLRGTPTQVNNYCSGYMEITTTKIDAQLNGLDTTI
ncbi:MAG: hypothetical protein WB988_04695 [Candidatus Nitrosopolaris sp.]